MPQYEVKAPDGKTYVVNAPDGATEQDAISYVQTNMYKAGAAPSTFASVKQGAGNLLAGGVRGAGSIGATILAPVDIVKDAISGKGLSLESNRQRRADMDGALQSLGADTDSTAFGAGKLLTEVAGTLGVGGAVANGARLLPGASRVAPLLDAIRTSGFSAGGMTGKTGMGVRVAGGAASGGAAAGLVNPDDAGTGAAIGAALPPALKAAGVAGSAVGRAAWEALTPSQQSMAVNTAKMTGRKLEDVLSAVQQQGPSILGIKPTVPQILQDDAISQLQRTVINAGDKTLRATEAAQNAQRLAGLERIAPVSGTVNEAADNAGRAIAGYAIPARVAEGKRVRGLFDAVDPFGESAIELPITQMQAARAKFLGPGTFGKDTATAQAIRTAEEIGTETIEAIKPMTKKAAGNPQTLEQAVRAAGGIRQNGMGELKDLQRRESGTTGLVSKMGRPIDLLAEDMHRRGFIPDADPDTLLQSLMGGRGRQVFAADRTDDSFRAAYEAGMGDAPEARTVLKPVPFQTVQNLRSSLNEAWKEASKNERTNAAAALSQMIDELDAKVALVAQGKGSPAEVFPADMVKSWKEAIAAHAGKKAKFDTGPQAGMFRRGGDGAAQLQGAEIPRKFFNSAGSQIEDAQAFKRLAGDQPELVRGLKGYAVTDMAQQTTKDGMLSASKMEKWLKSRDGALKETFGDSERALINEVFSGVRATDIANTAGMAKGSNTFQNAEAAKRALSSGLLDSSVVDIAFNRVPILGQFTGPMLSSLRKGAQASKAERLGGLLADPEVFSAELRAALERQARRQALGGLLANGPAAQFTYRAAPLVGSDR